MAAHAMMAGPSIYMAIFFFLVRMHTVILESWHLCIRPERPTDDDLLQRPKTRMQHAYTGAPIERMHSLVIISMQDPTPSS
jgi:hypothetical protein